MIHPAVNRFLSATAEARDITDVNIAAGAALEELGASPWPRRIRRAGATLATVVAITVVGDTFAASPVQAGISPFDPPHIITRETGADDWGDLPRANVFGHDLPWRARDGWLDRFADRLAR